MLPTRPKDASLSDVLNRLLDKGIFLKAELVLTLAKVPLIKIDLTALIAGIETMNTMKERARNINAEFSCRKEK